jgi:hypothetical protein
VGEPTKCSVYGYHKLYSTAEDIEWVEQGCRTAGIGCGDCKGRLAANIEKISQVDLDCDGTIGESKSPENADVSKEEDSKTAVSNMVVYSGFLHGLRFKVTVTVS